MNPHLNLLCDSGFFQNPYPAYQQLRADGRPLWLPQPAQALRTTGTWLVFGHAEIKRLLQETESISQDVQAYRREGMANFYDQNMLVRDGQDHHRLREMVADHFTSAFLQNFAVQLQGLTSQWLDTLGTPTELNVVDDFAAVLPMRAVALLLGTPQDDAAQIRAWTLALHDMSDGLLESTIPLTEPHALQALHGYCRQLLQSAVPAADPARESLLQRLRQRQQDSALSEDEALAMLALLLVAGNATVSALLSSTLWLLLRHPEQMKLAQQDPRWLDAAVHEALRFETPVQRTIFRITTAPVQLDGAVLEPGQQLSLVIGSAHRDERVYERPDEFDITRKSVPTLAFGRGIHICLGRHLALMEARIMLGTLLERMPRMRLLQETAVWRRNSMFRELQSLWVSPS